MRYNYMKLGQILQLIINSIELVNTAVLDGFRDLKRQLINLYIVGNKTYMNDAII